MRYDTQLAGLKNDLPNRNSILIALPSQTSVDQLASGLALYLALKQSGKRVDIVSENPVTVSQSNLYGVGEVLNTFPSLAHGDLILTLENVVMPDGTVPALEKLDWYPEGSNLNLVFHVVAGQRFEPRNITTKYSAGTHDLIIAVGADSLAALGNIYQSNLTQFQNTQIVNIDNSATNTSYGQTNVVDPSSSSVSEMMVDVIKGLNLPFDSDIASNILVGIYYATANLTVKVSPETFVAVGSAMQVGGKNPMVTQQTTEQNMPPVIEQQPVMGAQPAVNSPVSDLGLYQTTPNINPSGQMYNQAVPSVNQPVMDWSTQSSPGQAGFDIRAFAPQPNFQFDVTPPPAATPFAQPAPVTQQGPISFDQPAPQPSPEAEQPANPVNIQTPAPVVDQNVNPEVQTQNLNPEQTFEAVEGETVNPTPDWLTPKIYKGGGGSGGLG